MRTAKTIAEIRRRRAAMSGSVGFVPTMGYLHDGHIALVRRARRDTDNVVVSIFVNPTQFNSSEDLATYPRDIERDLSLLRGEGVDLVFVPSAGEVYPEGFRTWIEVERLTGRLEGESRPSHFRGVATVVAKLFNIVQPHFAYFGRKDAQQLLVIGKMAADLDMNLEIVPVQTVREPDGLAMSSRNARLDPLERQAATVLWRALSKAGELWEAGERDARRLRVEMTAIITAEPLAAIDYVSVADPDTLDELETIDRAALVSMAVRIGKVRLIDNITIGRD